MSGPSGDPAPNERARFNMARYCIARAAAAHPDKLALLVLADPADPKPEQWSFGGLEQAVLAIAATLEDLGLRRGDRIMIRLDNTTDYALLFFGAIAAGLVALPASSQLTEREAAFLLADSGASAVALAPHLAGATVPTGVRVIEARDIARMKAHPRRAAWADTAAEDPAFLVYTSGTTSSPKGVLHANRSAKGRQPMYQGWYALEPDDRMLHAGAFNWTFTLGTGLTDPWANGATAIVYTGAKDPAVWPRLITATGATLFAAVPSLFRQILKYAAPGRQSLGRLRHGLTAGEKPPPGLIEDWLAATGVPLYEALGMSEISTFISSSPTVPGRPGAIGKPQAGRRVAILPIEGGSAPLAAGETGLLAVHRSDPGLMLGYWNRPAEQAEVTRGDWFIGGDLASMDADGYVTHHGRANDIMKPMGYRVSPLEVEEVLAGHPDVAEVACAEVRVRADVTVIGAFIIPRDPARPPSAAAIMAFAAERLAAYKCPREVTILAALPRTANGKLRRAALAR